MNFEMCQGLVCFHCEPIKSNPSSLLLIFPPGLGQLLGNPRVRTMWYFLQIKNHHCTMWVARCLPAD